MVVECSQSCRLSLDNWCVDTEEKVITVIRIISCYLYFGCPGSIVSYSNDPFRNPMYSKVCLLQPPLTHEKAVNFIHKTEMQTKGFYLLLKIRS